MGELVKDLDARGERSTVAEPTEDIDSAARRSRVGQLVKRFDARGDAAFDRLRGRAAIDRIFYFASEIADFGVLWVMLACLRGLRHSVRDERAAVRAIGGVLVESAIVNIGIKSLFRRVRPRPTEPRPHNLRQPLTSSFPSGHATAAFCSALLLAEEDPLAPLYFGAATVVAASRVYVKIHHPSDVVAGVAVGLTLGALFRRLMPLGKNRLMPLGKNRLMPLGQGNRLMPLGKGSSR